ncbi:MAG: hypothetical protein H6837_01685 [Planctomycetes bacterium]|nr:hypothetical protein [Planctomycetota bacterium]
MTTPSLEHLALALLGIAGFGTLAPAQYAERASLPGSGRPDVDCSGRSIKNPRVRAVHTTDPSQRGGTAYLFDRDPFLAYQLGRNLNFREFRDRDGVFDTHIGQLIGPMPDKTTAKITGNNQLSCSGCHNLPQGNPGGGTNFHKDSGLGRNAPHYYGAGVMEMLALQIRTQILRQLDTNGDGWIHAREARQASRHLMVPTGAGPSIDFGDPRLDRGMTGTPRLNNIFRVWYVDGNGHPVTGATEVDGSKTVGYNFAMVVWGWGQGPGRSALNPTNRVFLWDPFKAHSGLESHDPSTADDPDGDGVSRPTLAGALQFPATHQPPDQGKNLDPLGFSRDDPDGDGYLNEISEGDLDLGEWFMLNAPRPAFAGTRHEYDVGVYVLRELGCAQCHVPSWKIEAKSGSGPHAFAGDRRLFDYETKWNATTQRLEGAIRPLYHRVGASYVRHLGSFVVDGLFTDFRHHDMGADLEETDLGGTKNRLWRTAPLWGVGSGFPWGHDGQSLTLEDIIRRHGGEAQASRNKWQNAPPFVRAWLINWLRKLQLFDIETLPCDVDGDGKIANHFRVAGMDTQQERFNAEWLFRNPVQIQGRFRNIDGQKIWSFAATNIPLAYGLDLPLRRDSDLDGWPDVWDHAPFTAGYKDGVR